ncbi:ImmA/IrrE family metallo-endopeptidase [Inediibacterium massiliense]|uniref:ImmA/IrrE family metallo-endopeptidase n=1 Tax=Inediibacterium massiliense TaxID=1658111 RepID=UPI000DA60D44
MEFRCFSCGHVLSDIVIISHFSCLHIYTSIKIVLAHELGHAILHSSKDIYFLKEYSLFPTGKYEIQANTFAAELLIDEKCLDKNLLKNLCINQIASYLEVPIELVKLKFNVN